MNPLGELICYFRTSHNSLEPSCSTEHYDWDDSNAKSKYKSTDIAKSLIVQINSNSVIPSSRYVVVFNIEIY